MSDASQLTWAAREHRALLTFNVSDFARMHYEWTARGFDHAGVIVSAHRPVGDIVRRLTRLAESLDAETMRNRLEYLANWPKE